MADRRPYWAAWWVRVLLGLALAWAVVIGGYLASGGLEGGLDGPCLGYADRIDHAVSAAEEPGWWPPERRCRIELEGGETLTRTYPDRDTWWIAAAALAAVVVLPAPFLRSRR